MTWSQLQAVPACVWLGILCAWTVLVYKVGFNQGWWHCWWRCKHQEWERRKRAMDKVRKSAESIKRSIAANAAKNRAYGRQARDRGQRTWWNRVDDRN